MAVWTAYRNGREDAEKTPFVLQPEQIGEFWTEERCHITELINDPKMPAFSLAIARVEPAVTASCPTGDQRNLYPETGQRRCRSEWEKHTAF